MPLTQDQVPFLQARFGLGYHLPYLLQGETLVGLKDMKVLEVGGSLPRELVIDTLEADQWVGLEAMRYWEELGETGGGTRPKTDLSIQINNVKNYSDIERYAVLEGLVENLPPCMEGAFDRIFSIACFEHIHTLGLALEKMHAALKPGGKLFTMFSPIWSAHDGHHLPIMNDFRGNKWSYSKSPIPPWAHLLLSPAQMEKHLCTRTDRKTASEMIFNIYHNQHINRLFTENYVEYVQQSPFRIEQLIPTFQAKIPENIQKSLELRYPGKKNFSNNGLLMILSKEPAF
jgi:SAM-dependent methyltransferase